MNGWVDIREAGDLRHHHAHYDATVILRPAQQVDIGTLSCNSPRFRDMDLYVNINDFRVVSCKQYATYPQDAYTLSRKRHMVRISNVWEV